MSDQPIRILLVDDDETDRMAVRRALTGFAISECADPRIALAQARTGSFDCILLDYLLGSTTALQLLPELRNGPPVIVLTGFGDAHVAVELMKAGASDYYSKDGLDGNHLAKGIRQALTLRSTRTRLERAERAQETNLHQLRELVKLAPRIYSGLELEARLEQAVAAARSVLGAGEAFIGVSIDGVHTCLVAEAGRVRPLGGDHAWRDFWPPSGELAEGAHLPSGEHLVACRLSPREATWSGVLAVRLVESPEPALLAASLLAQLGELVTVAVENVRLYQAVQRAVSARDAIMAVVSHDLRSPLNAFAMGIEVLDGSPEQSHSVLDRLRRSTQHMKRLIEDLLDVASIENQTLSVSLKDESLATLLEDARALATPLAEAAKIQLSIPKVDGLVKADRQRIGQVLSNLLTNAFKFTPENGEVRVEVELSAGEARIVVSDTGPGIPADHQPQLFDRFFRKDGRGLGLGLFIARALVHAHGGRIWVDSQPGHGSRFGFSLPR